MGYLADEPLEREAGNGGIIGALPVVPSRWVGVDRGVPGVQLWGQSQLSSTRLGTPQARLCHPRCGSHPNVSQGVSRAIFWSADWLGVGVLWPRTRVQLQSTPGRSMALEELRALRGISLK